jgi:uncharacterized repeat protein (TIGR01451 family)
MTERILGPTDSRRRRRILLGPLLVVALAALFLTAGAQAVHQENFFELGPGVATDENGLTNILGDGNAANGPDWADLFTATGAKKDANNNNIADCEESPGRECAFIADESSAGGATDPSTFSGFGTSNKNPDPISTADCASRTPPLTGSNCSPWGWDPGNVPAKDDLTNVYSYEVVPTSGPRANHVIVYGGIEREDPSGDSHVDLEYFQSQVALCSPAPCTSFTGIRTIGDAIVSMDFLRGGALGSVTVRRWDGNAYVLQGSAGGQGCFNSAGAAGDDICAFNNGGSINGGPWPNFDNHGNLIETLPTNAFTEIGVDLTNVIGGSPCISTFMGKTRSSGSFTAELKDFAGPTTFSVCVGGTTLTKTASATKVHTGDSVTYTYMEDNTGKDPLSNVVVSDDKCSPVTFVSGDTNGNNILDTTETWTYTCTTTLTATTTNTATGSGFDTLLNKTITFCADPSNPPPDTICDQNERATATVTVITPRTSLRKTAQVTITYSYRETNTGDDPLTGVSVTDDNCSPVTFASGDTNGNNVLDPGETWLFHCTKATSDGDDLNVTNTGTGHGTDSLNTPVPSAGESDSVTVTVTHNPPN